MSAATKRLRRAVFARACNACENCGQWVTEESGHLDHQFGRAKVPEAVSNCWALCVRCDLQKTVNEPSASFWLARIERHANRYGYTAEAELAATKRNTLAVKGRAA